MCSRGGEEAGIVRKEKEIHDCGMMSQHSTMVPGALRQEVQ